MVAKELWSVARGQNVTSGCENVTNLDHEADMSGKSPKNGRVAKDVRGRMLRGRNHFRGRKCTYLDISSQGAKCHMVAKDVMGRDAQGTKCHFRFRKCT